MSIQFGYGFFPGGDPRKFTPDEESNSDEEIAAWREACAAWDLGIQEDVGSSCFIAQDGTMVALITIAPFGVGMYEYEEDEEPEDEVVP